MLARLLYDDEPERAAPDLLALDRITLGAATTGMALLPADGGPVTGRAWLRALCTLIDELVHTMDWFGNEGRGSWQGRGCARAGCSTHGTASKVTPSSTCRRSKGACCFKWPAPWSGNRLSGLRTVGQA